MWRKLGDSERIDQVEPGVCSGPAGNALPVPYDRADSLGAVGVTMPPWPGRRRSAQSSTGSGSRLSEAQRLGERQERR